MRNLDIERIRQIKGLGAELLFLIESESMLLNHATDFTSLFATFYTERTL